MKRSLRLFLLLFVAVISFGAELGFAQEPSAPQQDTTIPVRRRRTDYGLVKNIAVMPYATLSYNLQSGQAFPKSAQGVGYGFGIAFDFAPDHQPLGLYVDFAYQDMRASATDGACKQISPTDETLQTVPVTHYFSYALAEVFMKLQSAKAGGYFLLGFSTGISTTGLSDKQGPGADEYSDWSTTTFYNKFRFDIRGGIGFKLANFGGHDIMFEGRFGYPVTVIISNYQDVCNGSGASGSWRDVSLQGNIGFRL